MKSLSKQLQSAALRLRDGLAHLDFAAPVTHVYQPLDYAWAPHELYLKQYGSTRKRVVFLGMNPGPYGMAQTGVPFGEISAVRDWLGIEAPVGKPADENPGKPVDGFACRRAEVSGRRLWGHFAEKFGTADAFFAEHFVTNYNPLLFLEKNRNYAADKLTVANHKHTVQELCDQHLREVIEALEPEWLIGVGNYAQTRAQETFNGTSLKIEKVLHPAPASPAANTRPEGWSDAEAQERLAVCLIKSLKASDLYWGHYATQQLSALGIW